MNTIAIELCAEDRARLDRIYEALTTNVAGYVVGQLEKYYIENKTEAAPAAARAGDNEAAEEHLTVDTPAEEVPAEGKETAKAEAVEEAPQVSKADIQKKVVELSSAGKKDQVREIVKAYADKVSTIPEDKLGEVWQKLTALEG